MSKKINDDRLKTMLLNEMLTYEQVAIRFGVTKSAIRIRCKSLNLDNRIIKLRAANKKAA